ncbi:hypothetical protein, partial [Streptomyces sp. NPDC014741]|uniref:hypothetical protein n=1 Tax=Streptomyces sp. NPDC014741 TaxID=3364902 RepID=UPI0037032DFF
PRAGAGAVAAPARLIAAGRGAAGAPRPVRRGRARRVPGPRAPLAQVRVGRPVSSARLPRARSAVAGRSVRR